MFKIRLPSVVATFIFIILFSSVSLTHADWVKPKDFYVIPPINDPINDVAYYEVRYKVLYHTSLERGDRSVTVTVKAGEHDPIFTDWSDSQTYVYNVQRGQDYEFPESGYFSFQFPYSNLNDVISGKENLEWKPHIVIQDGVFEETYDNYTPLAFTRADQNDAEIYFWYNDNSGDSFAEGADYDQVASSSNITTQNGVATLSGAGEIVYTFSPAPNDRVGYSECNANFDGSNVSSLRIIVEAEGETFWAENDAEIYIDVLKSPESRLYRWEKIGSIGGRKQHYESVVSIEDDSGRPKIPSKSGFLWEACQKGLSGQVKIVAKDNRTVKIHSVRFAHGVSKYGHSINIDVRGPGSTSPINGSFDHYIIGGDVVITATPQIGSHFIKWSGDLNSTEPSVAISIRKHMYITAEFAVNEQILDPNSDTIQTMIDSAQNGDVITIPDGVYKGLGNKNIDFKNKFITLISENGPNSCVIDCENEGRGFIFQNGEGNGSVLSGFKIINSSVTDGEGNGGGILCKNNSSPMIENCIISDGYAVSGGGEFHATLLHQK